MQGEEQFETPVTNILSLEYFMHNFFNTVTTLLNEVYYIHFIIY